MNQIQLQGHFQQVISCLVVDGLGLETSFKHLRCSTRPPGTSFCVLPAVSEKLNVSSGCRFLSSSVFQGRQHATNAKVRRQQARAASSLFPNKGLLTRKVGNNRPTTSCVSNMIPAKFQEYFQFAVCELLAGMHLCILFACVNTLTLLLPLPINACPWMHTCRHCICASTSQSSPVEQQAFNELIGVLTVLLANMSSVAAQPSGASIATNAMILYSRLSC